MILGVVLVCVENGVGMRVQNKLCIAKSLTRPWSGHQKKHNHLWPREMLEDDTQIMLPGGNRPTGGEGNL